VNIDDLLPENSALKVELFPWCPDFPMDQQGEVKTLPAGLKAGESDTVTELANLRIKSACAHR